MKRKILFGLALLTLLSGCGTGAGTANAPTSSLTLFPQASSNPLEQTEPVVPTGTANTGTATAAPAATPTAAPTATPSLIQSVVNTDLSTYTYLVNREYLLPEDYVPEGLMTPDVLFPFSDTTIDKAKMVPEAARALAELFDAAFEEEKLVLYGVSAYRSYQRQYTIYATNLARYGISHSNRYSAAPGSSEHQTGLSIDISCRSEGYDLEETFADTPEGRWVAANAHRFGFILRYPKGKESITGYSYEPWHIRYVGTELAVLLYESGLTLDEYYGVSCTLTEDYLNTTPLIDTTTERYLSIYRQYH